MLQHAWMMFVYLTVKV